MRLSDITPYPVLLPDPAPPELSDQEVLRVTSNTPRMDLELLLRQRRAPTVYHELQRIAGEINREIAALSGTTLEDHLARKRTMQRWQLLDALVKHQAALVLQRVTVSPHEVEALLLRWLLLLFPVVKDTHKEMAGRRVVAGIITPTAGGRHE